MSGSTNPTTASTARAGTKKTLLGAGVGNALEWYDLGVYSALVPFIATRFFAEHDRFSAVLSTLAVFAVGFLARPFGGWLFGLISDRWGRRNAMTLSVTGAASGTLLIAISPTYATVGAVASAILLLARLIQGVAHGGELPSAQTYISEIAPDRRRGLWSSLIYLSGTIGVLCSTAIGAVLSMLLTDQQMAAWGWRVPFLIGGLTGVYALLVRRRMDESTPFRRQGTTADGKAITRAVLRFPKRTLQVVGMTAGLTVAFYIWGTSTTQFAINTRGVPATGALWAGVGAQLVMIAALPLWGSLSDKIGRKPVLLISTLGLALLNFPLNAMINSNPWRLFFSMSIAMLLIAASAAILPAVFAEIFPTHIRTIGVAVPYSVAVALFGGAAPYLQTWFSGGASSGWFAAYVSTLLLVSAGTLMSLPETRALPLR